MSVPFVGGGGRTTVSITVYGPTFQLKNISSQCQIMFHLVGDVGKGGLNVNGSVSK